MSDIPSTTASGDGILKPRQLVVLALPALMIGVLSALILWILDVAAEALEHLIWTTAPGAMGIDPSSWWYIVGILTITGVLVALVVQFAPGRGGHDSATVEFLAPVVKLSALPGIAIVIVLGLAGGVSLGPESPIISINTAIAVALLARLAPKISSEFPIMMTAAGTIGAMFGTPVAAALVFTGLVAAATKGGHLWDRMFLPLTAAGASAVTMVLLGGGTMVVHVPSYGSPHPLDLLTGSAVAVGAGAIAIAAIVIFPHAHRLFHRLGRPVLYITVGGVVLGILGAIGGPITLFKGLHQMQHLVEDRAHFGGGALLAIALLKLLALVVAAAAGFRGGRVFPAVFVGVALGLLGHLLLPGLPVGLAVACGVLGLTLAVSRDGWLSLFMAVAVTGDITVLPVLCIIVLPTWLLITGAPEMIIHAKPTVPSDALSVQVTRRD